MKVLTFILTATAILTCTRAYAQGLSAPDDPSQAPVVAATDSTGATTQAPAPSPLHDDPAESFHDERNFIRHGNNQFNDSNWHRALEYYNKALMVNAGSLAARYNKAAALLNMASADNAGTEADPRRQAAEILTDLVDDARSHRPEIAQRALYNLGNICYNDGQYGQAIGMYERSLMLNPDDIDARYNLRLAQLKQEQEQQQQNEDQQQNEEQQQQQQQQQNEDQQQQQQQQPEPMTQSAQQILQSMQNKENQTRQRVEQEEPQQGQRRQPEKPW